MTHFLKTRRPDPAGPMQIPSYLRTAGKAIAGVRKYLSQNSADQEAAQHEAKSMLYAAINQAATKIDRLMVLQRMLRELMAAVNTHAALLAHERTAVLYLLQEIAEKYEIEMGDGN